MACGRKIGIYDCCSVVQGDCLQLMKEIPSEIFRCECGKDVSGEGGVYHIAAGHKMQDGPAIDAVITDPPYGVNFDTDYTRFKGGFAGNRIYPAVHGDDKPFDPRPWLSFRRTILWGANCFPQYLSMGTWLIWDKRHETGKAFLADGESAWMNYGHGTYICSIPWQGFNRTEETFHPTQKPTELMQWCIKRAGMPETILDPYCGSGTTLVAAKKLGRHFLGFEISEEYCKIARERIARIEAQPSLFEPKPEQMKLKDVPTFDQKLPVDLG